MMLHPATAHFAIALPVVASVFSLIYLFTRSEGMSKVASRTAFVAALAMIAAWYTGNQAGPEIYDYLSPDGQKELLEHKGFGLYLAIGMSVVALLRMAGCRLKNFAIEVVATLLIFAVTAATFAQGKEGGEIVYEHGMPFKAYMMKDSLKTAVSDAEEAEDDEAKLEAYEDGIDEALSMVEDESDESQEEESE